jgi:hypothetical protein
MNFAYVDGKDKQPAMLAMHPRMSARTLFVKLQAAAGVKAGAYGSAWVDGTSLMLQLDKPMSGLVKKVRAPVRACGFRIAKAVLWNADGTSRRSPPAARMRYGIADCWTSRSPRPRQPTSWGPWPRCGRSSSCSTNRRRAPRRRRAERALIGPRFGPSGCGAAGREGLLHCGTTSSRTLQRGEAVRAACPPRARLAPVPNPSRPSVGEDLPTPGHPRCRATRAGLRCVAPTATRGRASPTVHLGLGRRRPHRGARRAWPARQARAVAQRPAHRHAAGFSRRPARRHGARLPGRREPAGSAAPQRRPARHAGADQPSGHRPDVHRPATVALRLHHHPGRRRHASRWSTARRRRATR